MYITEHLWDQHWEDGDVLWSGGKDDLVSHTELSFVPVTIDKEIIRTEEHFLELIQLEYDCQIFFLTLNEEIDLKKLFFQESVQEQVGKSFDTVSYDGKEIVSDIDYGDQEECNLLDFMKGYLDTKSPDYNVKHNIK